MQKKIIAVLGAGFGGLRAATVLARKLSRHGLESRYQVALIDRNDHHTYTPLLYEAATTSKETANMCDLHNLVAYNIPELLARSGVEFIKKEISEVDIERGIVRFSPGGELKVDYIVLALGAEPHFFNIPGVQEHSIPFKTLLDAIRVRDTIWNRAMENPARDISVLIGGAGSSGVELAAEIKNWCGELAGNFPKCRLAVTIVEQATSILPGFEARVVSRVSSRLAQLSVSLILGKKISAARAKEVDLEDGTHLPFDVFIWAGGIKAPTTLSRVKMATEEKGRAVVGAGMECLPETPHLKLATAVYALGDNVCFANPRTGLPIPSVARAAISQANIVAWNITEEIRARENPINIANLKKYIPKEYPHVIPVGGKFAVAKIGPIIISGFFGWILKGLVELNYLISILPISKALRVWIKGLAVFMHNDRLG